jgi:D-threo-aldose 1-dehydrogenase
MIGQYRARLGKTPLEVSRLGLGGAPLGGLYTDISENAASAAVERALALGINLFDTAPLYGSGKSESRYGRVLPRHQRSSFIISTKVGFSLVPENPAQDEDIFFPFENPPPLRPACDYSYDGAMRSLEESLKRLQLDRVDIMYIHDPVGFYDETMKGAYQALRKLRDQGVVGAVGAAMNQAEMMIRFAQEGEFDCFQLAGRYTLIEHAPLKDFLPLCAAKQISVIIGSPYNSGILATGAKPGARYKYLDAPPEILEKVRQIEAVCGRHSVPLKAAALQFPLGHPAVAAVIPGGRSAAEVEENHQMLSLPIPSEFWLELRETGLIPSEAPVAFS